MARGQVGAAEKQLGTTNAVAGQQGKQATALENKLIPGYESLMDTGYMNPAEEAAATTNEMGATTSPFQAQKFQANNTAAATRNAAGQEANQDALAMEEGRAAGDTAAQLQQQKMQNQEAGMYGLGQLEQGNLSAEEAMYGLGPGTLQARAAGPSMAQGFQSYASGIKDLSQSASGIGGMMAGG